MNALFNVAKSFVPAFTRSGLVKTTIRELCSDHTDKIIRYGSLAPHATYVNTFGEELVSALKKYHPSTHYFIIKIYRDEYFNFEMSLLNAGISYTLLHNGIIQAQRRFPDLIITNTPLIITVNDSIIADLPSF